MPQPHDDYPRASLAAAGERLTRRQVLALLSTASLGLLAAACAQTTAPTPTTAPKATTAPTTAPTAAPTTAAATATTAATPARTPTTAATTPVATPTTAAKPAATTPPATGAAQRIEVAASEFKFEPKDISVKAGEVTFAVRNAGTIEHNFAIEGRGGESIARIPTIDVGKTEELKVTLSPGSYTIACTFPGHREAGMVGTLTVA